MYLYLDYSVDLQAELSSENTKGIKAFSFICFISKPFNLWSSFFLVIFLPTSYIPQNIHSFFSKILSTITLLGWYFQGTPSSLGLIKDTHALWGENRPHFIGDILRYGPSFPHLSLGRQQNITVAPKMKSWEVPSASLTSDRASWVHE